MIRAALILYFIGGVAFASAADNSPLDPLPPEAVPKISAEEVQQLVKQLGSDNYSDRLKAHRQLEALGKHVLPLLELIPKQADPEVRWRLGSIKRVVQRDPLVGTQWYMECPGNKVSLKPKTIELQAGGKFAVVIGTNTNNDDEAWEMGEGETLVLHFNNKYATYTGKWVNRDTIKGTAHNIKGKSWDWTATRVRQ